MYKAFNLLTIPCMMMHYICNIYSFSIKLLFKTGDIFSKQKSVAFSEKNSKKLQIKICRGGANNIWLVS